MYWARSATTAGRSEGKLPDGNDTRAPYRVVYRPAVSHDITPAPSSQQGSARESSHAVRPDDADTPVRASTNHERRSCEFHNRLGGRTPLYLDVHGKRTASRTVRSTVSRRDFLGGGG
jgi:hypothetical protein